METPAHNRTPLGDITMSSKTNRPRHFNNHSGVKRSPPSPFSPRIKSASSANLRHKRVLTTPEAEQRPHITALWNAISPPMSRAQIEAEHSRRLQEVIEFANLERSYSA